MSASFHGEDGAALIQQILAWQAQAQPGRYDLTSERLTAALHAAGHAVTPVDVFLWLVELEGKGCLTLLGRVGTVVNVRKVDVAALQCLL